MNECDPTQILIDHASLANPLFWSGLIGSALWTIAYVVFVREGLRARIYTLPLVAICLNITWEFMAVTLIDNPIPAWRWLERSWLAVDVVLLGLLLWYGRAVQRVADLREHFYPVVIATLALGFVGQYAFIGFFADFQGLIAAFVINLIMSVAFVIMFYLRPDQRGLSYAGAWLKMFGTLGTAIECHTLIPALRCEATPAGFMTFLYVTIFGFDLLYVLLLRRARRAADNR